MERFTPIRISNKDKQEYQKLVRNSKAKIRRTHNKYGIDLSSEVNLPKLKDFKTRNQFNEWKEQQSSFLNRGNLKYQFKKNPYGVVASKKEILQVERDTKKAQRVAEKIQKQASNKPFISAGKQQGTVGQRMTMMAKPSLAGISRPPDFKFDSIRTREHFIKKKDNMARRVDDGYYDEKKEKMLSNFIDILGLSFNSQADTLIDELQNINAHDFFEIYLMFDEFDFDLFDSDGQMVNADEGTINQMLTYLEQYENGDINMDLKGF